MTAPRAIPCVLVVASLALTGCTAETVQPPRGESSAGGVIGGDGSGVTAPPTPTGLDPVGYRRELEAAVGPVRDSLESLADAKTRKTLRKRLDGASDALRDAGGRLQALTPPAGTEAAHIAYVTQLAALSSGLDTVELSVGAGSVCTASSVMTALGEAGDIKDLDRAGEDLARLGDYPADAVTVKIPGRQSRRWSNGRFLRSESRTGRGSLKIDNGSSYDAVVTVIRGKKKAFSVYVRKKKKFTVSGVRDGKYKIYFTQGQDWQSKARAFGRMCSFQLFGSSLRFKTRYTSTHVRWNNWTITLHGVRGGTIRTKNVDPDDFPD
ncbi:hypothetical protein SAMN05421505_11971 [Sinosporangium album]|uniref:Uncharacterized protein n=1 Tax=Sinosporangium album TaxID=504805 RepID=A0A1G8E0R4_9ACTN|nr:hypothetical protein [Sinosporangium album]SDH63562.1 hypothetical protein SAMN05421505_11971 [Sinosporangium album]